MSWETKHEFVDHQTGMHVMHLEHSETGAVHRAQIHIGHDSCPACGAVHPKTNTGELDPKAIRHHIITALETVHSNIEAYRVKHGLKKKRR